MGERYQIHLIVTKEQGWDYDTENKTRCMSVHAQWMWGYHIVKNLFRLIDTLKKSNFGEYSGAFGEFEDYVMSILRVNKYLEGGYYPYRLYKEEEAYLTTQGDSNHGWCVMRVTLNKKGNVKVETKLYDYNGVEESKESVLGEALKYIEFDYSSEKPSVKEAAIQKIEVMCRRSRFNNTDDDLQEIFNGEVNKWNKEHKTKKE